MSTKHVTVQDIKALTNAQYDACRVSAGKRIKRRAGDKPTRKRFERELEPLFSLLDFVALLVGLSAWLVSSIHILTHAARQAAVSYSTTISGVDFAGITVDQMTYGTIHQVGLITLAESAMILFMVMHSSRARRDQRRGENVITYALRNTFTIPLLLSLMAAGFTLYANMQSGVGVLESLLPPAVTIGLGIYFERLLAEMIKRRKAVTTDYLQAMKAWDAAQGDIESHPDYLPYFRQALAQKLMGLKPQRDYGDIPIVVVKQAVARELYRDTWAYEADAPAVGSAPLNPFEVATATAVKAPAVATGNGQG